MIFLKYDADGLQITMATPHRVKYDIPESLCWFRPSYGRKLHGVTFSLRASDRKSPKKPRVTIEGRSEVSS